MRAVFVVLFAFCVGWSLHRATATINANSRPAGFVHGVFHGALMPCTLPHLLVGYDVNIYAQNNAGRPYKLGYTVGVNSCGALFFGIFFWRVNRWRRQRNGTAEQMNGTNPSNLQ